MPRRRAADNPRRRRQRARRDTAGSDAGTDANGQPPFDGTKKAEVGVADLVPSANDLSALSRGELEKKVATLSDDLALANTESEYFRQQWQDLRLRDEALGRRRPHGRRTEDARTGWSRR